MKQLVNLLFSNLQHIHISRNVLSLTIMTLFLVGSDASGDLFSDASFDDEVLADLDRLETEKVVCRP